MVSAAAPDQTEGQVFQMTEAQLMRLLNEAKNGALYLPPGAYRGEKGVPYRDVLAPTGRIKEFKDEAGKVIRRQQVLKKQQRLVMLVTDPTPQGLVATAKACKRRANANGPDFYHPQWGWIRCGFKRETDVAENLGTGAEQFEMVLEDIGGEDTYGDSTVTMQGVPIETDESAQDATDAPVEPISAGSGRRSKETDVAYDNLLRLSGPTDGNSIEASSITADADLSGGWRYVEKYRQGYVDCRIAGSFDRTTGDEVLAFEVYEATDAIGTGSTLIATSANLTATNAANLGASTANGKVAGTLSDGPTRVGFSTGSGGWIKGRANVGGTTPIAASVSMNVVMTAGAYQASGI